MTNERWQEVQTLYFELADLGPEERAVRLESLARSDPELGDRLGRLLAAHDRSDELLGSFDDLLSQLEFETRSPPNEEPSGPDPHGLVGRTISHYEVIELLGAGGMGVLYKAADAQLGRTVALKFLPPQWSLDSAFKQRFLLEARAVAALDHNNVCTIHEIGETEDGQLFIAMAFYEGETVREKIARGPLAVDEALDLATQAMSGLAAAHGAGLIHRDIKPANLMVTESGVLKVLDFGLAKTADASLTEPGMRLGTPAYMSPEQTRGEDVDEGTDLWSLGVVLYEMLTGRRPFRGDGNSAVIHAIRHEDPAPPGELREDVPADVEELVLRLLSKNPKARHQAAEALSIQPTGPGARQVGGAESTPTRYSRLPTGQHAAFWDLRRRSPWQILGGYVIAAWIVLQVAETLGSLVGLPLWFGRSLLAVLLLILPLLLVTSLVQATRRPDALREDTARRRMRRFFSWRHTAYTVAAVLLVLSAATGGYMVMRSLGIGPAGTLIASGRLDDRAAVLLADFEARDSALAGTATELFRVDLSQSPNVRLVGSAEVAAALERMARSPATPLDAELALEIARREGLQAVIGGQIRRAGTGYLLSARIVAAADGQVLASRRETVTDSTGLIEAIDKLSRKVRERIGESFRSIQQSPHLEQVTTSSLEALRKYSEARAAYRNDNWERELALLEEAVALDTSFAMAWRRLGAILLNRGESSRANEALTRAYRHRDRLTEWERYGTSASYHMIVTREYDRAIAEWENLSALVPDNPGAYTNLGLIYIWRREFARAEEMHAKALALDSTSVAAWQNLAVSQAHQGRYADAIRTLERFDQRFPGSSSTDYFTGLIEAGRGDYDGAEAAFQSLRDESGGSLFWTEYAESGLAAVRMVQGRLGDAEHHLAGGMAASEQRGLMDRYLQSASSLAAAEILVREDPARGVERLEAALERAGLESLPPLDRPYLTVAGVYALGGDPTRARELLVDFQREVPDPPRGSESDLHGTRATIALAEGRHEEAADEFRLAAAAAPCPTCWLPELAWAYDLSGQADSAIAIYQRYLDTPDFNRLRVDGSWLARTHERLGELYDGRGDGKNAALHYSRFVELWEQADDELQPRVRAAQRRLEELLALQG